MARSPRKRQVRKHVCFLSFPLTYLQFLLAVLFCFSGLSFFMLYLLLSFAFFIRLCHSFVFRFFCSLSVIAPFLRYFLFLFPSCFFAPFRRSFIDLHLVA